MIDSSVAATIALVYCTCCAVRRFLGCTRGVRSWCFQHRQALGYGLHRLLSWNYWSHCCLISESADDSPYLCFIDLSGFIDFGCFCCTSLLWASWSRSSWRWSLQRVKIFPISGRWRTYLPTRSWSSGWPSWNCTICGLTCISWISSTILHNLPVAHKSQLDLSSPSVRFITFS